MCWLCVVVLGAHLVLSVLAALIYYVLAMCCGVWSAPGAVSACCTYVLCVAYM